MTLLKGGMFDNSTSTIASKNISLINVFELMEDHNYTIDAFFSVFRKENIVENFSNFGTVIRSIIIVYFLLCFSSFRHLWSAITSCH